MVDLTRPDRHRQKFPLTPPEWQRCVACGEFMNVGTMRTVSGRSADLGDMLSGGRWICLNRKACAKRYSARNGARSILHAVVQSEEWATGGLLLVTRDPRRAHIHAARIGACVVHWHIDTDYEQDRT